MIENITYTKAINIDESRSIQLNFTDPEENIEILKEIGTLNGVDNFSKYCVGYSINITMDTINDFHGGHTLFNEDYHYNPEESKISEKKVENRVKWIVGFEYTPDKLREEVKNFQEWFDKNSNFNQQVWEEAVNRWIAIRKKINSEVLKDEKIKDAYSYYKKKDQEISALNYEGKLKLK